jgi:hypothetical protein
MGRGPLSRLGSRSYSTTVNSSILMAMATVKEAIGIYDPSTVLGSSVHFQQLANGFFQAEG